MSTTKQATEIEVEVCEIDEVSPVVTRPHSSDTPTRDPGWQDWSQWQGRIQRLDSRWWPLWVILGTVAVALMLTVGLVAGIVFLAFRIVLRILRAIFG